MLNMYRDNAEKLLGEQGSDKAVDYTPHDERDEEKQQRNKISLISKNKWKFFIAIFIAILAFCSIVSVGFSTYKLSDLSLDKKEISSLGKDILQIKLQRKKFEDDITLLFVGHSRQNEDLDNLETTLQKITVTFNELRKKLNNLTINYERKVKLHEEMQKQIDAVEMDNRKKFGEFNQKQINLKQNLNNMAKAQPGLRNYMKETQRSLQKETERAVQRLRNEFRASQSKLEADSRAIQNSQNELRANQQSLLEKISEMKNYIKTEPNAG